jgi:hypothetical protein
MRFGTENSWSNFVRSVFDLNFFETCLAATSHKIESNCMNILIKILTVQKIVLYDMRHQLNQANIYFIITLNT